jgi:hypothetical protein
MRTHLDAKDMARTLRAALAGKADLTHSQSLEIVARQFGFDNWNILAAKISGAGETGPAISVSRVSPILRIFDETKAREFYVDFLGFALDWEHRFADGLPLYAQVSRAGMTLHLSGHHGDASPGSNVFVTMKGVLAYQRELIGKNYANLRPGVEEAPWGAMMEVIDPFSNRIRFCEQQE